MKKGMPAKKIVRISFMAVLLYVVQVALSFIPNCELVTTLIIVFTLVFGGETLFATYIFALLEAVTYGFGWWVLIYFYIWQLLVLWVFLLKKIIKQNWILWSVFSGIYGLTFGFFCSLEYLIIDRSLMLSYWISGLPFDLWHGVTNFVMTLATGKILYNAMKKISEKVQG